MKKNIVHSRRIYREGAALIVVILLVLAATAVGLVSLHITQNDNRMATAFQYTRQAANAAHQSGVYLLQNSQEDANMMLARQKKNGYEAAMEKGGQDAWNAINSASDWKYPQDIREFSGMSTILPTSADGTRLLGDLARSTIQAAAIGSRMLDNAPVAGFSKGDAYCNFTEHGDAYALVGRAVPLRSKGNTHYYLLADLNSHVSAYKREMGLIKINAATCN